MPAYDHCLQEPAPNVPFHTVPVFLTAYGRKLKKAGAGPLFRPLPFNSYNLTFCDA